MSGRNRLTRNVLKQFKFLSVAIALGWSFSCQQDSVQPVDLSPELWPPTDLQRYTKLNQTYDQPHPLGRGNRGMVVGTSSALAVRAGVEALKQGGSAADAVMTTALTQITVGAGAAVSFAGAMVMTYYDASTGTVHSMNASYDTVRGETDPLSIPPGGPSGRGTLVPGFMAGVAAAHERFGTLPFAALFEPSIYFAEEGFEVDTKLASRIGARKEVITRFPGTKRIFTRDDGALKAEGDLFQQPELARTLRRVSVEGSAYIYRGEWAQKLVEALAREGGKMTLEDLGAYDVIWSEPYRTSYRGYEVYAPGLPSFGGVNTIEALNLLELADLPSQGHHGTSAESLYWLIQISRVPDLLSPPLAGSAVPPELLERYLSGIDLSPGSRIKKETAALLWERMKGPGWSELQREAAQARKEKSESLDSLLKGFKKKSPKKPGHTSAVVAVDEAGNVAAIIHSINSSIWGNTGIFVDGISIPDSASFQQELVSQVGPGGRVPEWDNPFVVLKDGKPFLTGGSVGFGYWEASLQALVNVLDFGLDPKKAVEKPQIRKNWPAEEPLRLPSGEGGFPVNVLTAVQEMGLNLEIVSDPKDASFPGYWVGIRIEPETGALEGGVPPHNMNGHASGY